jgi:hypothetical protein
MSSLWDAVFIQVLDCTGPLMLNLRGTPYKREDDASEHFQFCKILRIHRSGSFLAAGGIHLTEIKSPQNSRVKTTW